MATRKKAKSKTKATRKKRRAAKAATRRKTKTARKKPVKKAPVRRASPKKARSAAKAAANRRQSARRRPQLHPCRACPRNPPRRRNASASSPTITATCQSRSCGLSPVTSRHCEAHAVPDFGWAIGDRDGTAWLGW
jgi:citrate synthase